MVPFLHILETLLFFSTAQTALLVSVISKLHVHRDNHSFDMTDMLKVFGTANGRHARRHTSTVPWENADVLLSFPSSHL